MTTTVDLDQLEIGIQEDFDPDNPEPLLVNLDGSTLTVTGYAGASSTRSGSHSTNTVLATLTTSPVVVCATDGLTHKGGWKVSVRAYGQYPGVRVRLAWKAGDGPITREPWVDLPGATDWYDLSLQTINIPELPSGHNWTAFIEAYATIGSPTTIDIDFVDFLPSRSGRARGPLKLETITAFSARDEFDQSAGTLNAKALADGGNWATSGATTDLAVEATGHTAQRSKTSDATDFGRIAIAGTATFTAVVVGLDFKSSAPGGATVFAIARFTDDSNFAYFSFSGSSGDSLVEITSVVAGSTPFGISGSTQPFPADTWGRLRFVIDAAGVVSCWVSIGNGPYTLVLRGQDSTLATGGALESGKVGFADRNPTAAAETRNYDNFVAAVPDIDAVVFAGQSARFTHNAAYRENAAGTSEGTVPTFEGQHLTIPPATRADRKHRLVVKARQFDGASGLPDRGLDESLSASLVIQPRVVLLGEGSIGS